MCLRVQLITGDPSFREALRCLLDRERDMVIVNEASNSDGARAGAASARPDVVVLDAELGGDGALELACSLKKKHPRARVVLLTSHPTSSAASAALSASASGYAGKLEPVRDIVGAIRLVGGGGSYICRDLVGVQASAEPGPARGPAEIDGPQGRLRANSHRD